MFLQRLILTLFLCLASISNAESPASDSLFSSLKSGLFGKEQKFLKPEDAFKVKAAARDGNTVVVDFAPAEGYYLYRARLKFVLQNAAGSKIAQVSLPKGEIKDDLNLGKTEVYHQPFQAVLAVDGAAGKLALLVTYQGCSEKGLCYEPIDAKFDLQLPASAARTDETSRIAALFSGGNYWLILLSFAGFGLLLSLTPCTFPMIPILSGIIVGHGGHMTRSKGFFLSLAYVLGLAIVYSIAGIAAGFSGVLVSEALQNPWALGSFAFVFVLLALSMFGFYDLQMPTFLQSKLSDASNRLKGGHLSGVFLMGALSAVIVGPCCAAPLAGALLYIGQTHDVLLGGSALFAMGIGMGLPLLAIGISAGSLLPKAGPWMQSVKNFFGVVLLGLAIWIVSPLVPALANMLLWAALLIISAIYLHAIDPLPLGASGFRKLWKGVGVIALLLGMALLAGALSGGRDILQPLAGLRTAGAAQDAMHFERVRSIAELDERLATARGRYVMLDFYADWCISCKEMERGAFSDPKVRSRLAGAVLLQADVTANSADDAALLKRFRLFGPPGIVFFDRQGGESVHLIGAQDTASFLSALDALLS
ncbi:MAG: protein-disulfide reductase DsbD [Burkholderiales bacterium]|nr:protein-disulfide reductase DsbD [Burkholderiales bacterium]